MVSEDIPAGLSLCRTAGWNQTAEDWELFLRLSPQGCRVAVDDEGRVRGTVATVRYESGLCWIGMVLVDPAYRRMGIGAGLLREALRLFSDQDTVKLDATPAGKQVYVQLDFRDELPISRMEITQGEKHYAAAGHVRRIHADDLPGIMATDQTVFGARRDVVLRSLLVRAPQFAWVSERAGRIQGYCFGRIGHKFAHIGPVVADDIDTAKDVVKAALSEVPGRPVVLDALCHSSPWLQWLKSIGFTGQRPLIRMYRGENTHAGIAERQFAILGPEFG